MISLAGPADAVRGPVKIAVQLPPRTQIVGAQVDGKPLIVAQALEVDTAQLPDGVHHLTVDAEDQSFRRNHAQASLDIRSDNTAPQLTVDAQPGGATQGHTWLMKVQSNEQAARK